MTLLLLDSAKCFEEASSPFSTEWLSEHHVTADECFDLSQVIASAIKLYTYLPNDQRLTWELKRVITESELSEDIKRYMIASLNFNQTLRQFKKEKP